MLERDAQLVAGRAPVPVEAQRPGRVRLDLGPVGLEEGEHALDAVGRAQPSTAGRRLPLRSSGGT